MIAKGCFYHLVMVREYILCVDQLQGASYFSKIYIRSGYQQFWVRGDDISKNGFLEPGMVITSFSYVVGLTNARRRLWT